jgi:Tfp pilus assembly protein PilO
MIDFSSYLKKIILSSLFFILIFAAAIFIFIIPSAKHLAEAKKEISKQKTALEEVYIQGQNLRKISDNLKTVEPNLENLKKIFISLEDDFKFVTALEEAAENSGVRQTISGLNYPDKESFKKTSFQKIPLQLTTTGNFLSQMKYLSALEALDYYISIKTLEISGRSDGPEEEGRIDMQLTAETYWQE